ncbi:hypothetical protein CGZ95_13275 [Enemella evansiae]|uniref:hypothetical protein n=1 Tax=Enemella evansiae TaxID=2016499 RepID=UPI000B964A69|nr:hypothetical protein [Enemella evansiae]OYN98165.1 hypothetical protein CGZ95_13275 [Enemella evansiae]
MTKRDGRRGPISATELMAELANDPGYQRAIQQQDAEFQAMDEALARAEQPILADLHEAGIEVESVWDLVNTSDPYPAALPVLMNHFERGGYPERVMESLGRALAVEPSVVYWERLKTRWLKARDPGEEDGAAAALAACATRDQFEDLVEFLSVEEGGETRIYFIRPILKVGGNRGREVVEALRSSPVFGKEATALLKARKNRK